MSALGFVVSFLAGVAEVAVHDGLFSWHFAPIVAVGVLAMIAGTSFGLGIGAGAAGLAATVAGGQFGWTLPLLWFAVAVFAPQPHPATASSAITTWPLQPGDSVAANTAAVVLTAIGLAAYMRWGGRK